MQDEASFAAVGDSGPKGPRRPSLCWISRRAAADLRVELRLFRLRAENLLAGLVELLGEIPTWRMLESVSQARCKQVVGDTVIFAHVEEHGCPRPKHRVPGVASSCTGRSLTVMTDSGPARDGARAGSPFHERPVLFGLSLAAAAGGGQPLQRSALSSSEGGPPKNANQSEMPAATRVAASAR